MGGNTRSHPRGGDGTRAQKGEGKIKIDETIDYKYYRETRLDNEYQLYREKWREAPLKHEVTNFPLNLDIEINSTCNLKCTECGFHSSKGIYKINGEYMPLHVYKQLIDEGAIHGLRAIKLNYRGEPLMHPNLVEMVRYAKKKGIIDVMFNTNGLLLTPFLSRDLLDAGLDQIFFSIDDHRADVYDKIRVGSNFQRILLNLLVFKITRDMLKSKCHVRVSKVVIGDPLEQEFRERFQPHADSIGFQAWYDYGIEVDNGKPSHYECAYPWQRMMVLVDGAIATCCNDPHENKILGHFPETTLHEAWHSDKFNDIRKKHQAHLTHLIPQCRKCHMRDKFM